MKLGMFRLASNTGYSHSTFPGSLLLASLLFRRTRLLHCRAFAIVCLIIIEMGSLAIIPLGIAIRQRALAIYSLA